MNWWNELTGLQQILATIAMPATLIMIIQFVLMLFGFIGDGADGADVGDLSDGTDLGDLDGGADSPDIIEVTDGSDIGDSGGLDIHGGFDTHGEVNTAGHHAQEGAHSTDVLKLFTIRGIIAFFAIGGWFGVAAISWGISVPGSLAIAAVTGYLALYFVAWSFRLALRLQQSGNINIQNAIGSNGHVYIPVPPLKSGEGKVNVIVQDRLSEFSAVTNAERTLKTGEKITVIGIEKEDVLIVSPGNPPSGIIIEKEF